MARRRKHGNIGGVIGPARGGSIGGGQRGGSGLASPSVSPAQMGGGGIVAASAPPQAFQSTYQGPFNPGGPPIDPQYEAYKLSAGRNLAIGNADATYQRGVLDQEYGYGAGGAANPYSRAKLLEESYKRSKLGTTNQYAGSGQMTSGAYGRMQGENQRQYSISADQNRRAYDQAVYGINLGQAQNAANYGIGLDDQAFQKLLRALGGG